MSWPAFVVWIVIIAAALSRGPTLIYVFQIVVIFGTLQMVPGGTGAMNFLPGSICAGFFAAKTLLRRENLVQALAISVNPFRAGLFGAFFFYAVLTCYVLPRLFAGLIIVVPVAGVGADVLRPTSGNLTQPAYMLLSFATTLCFGVLTSNLSFQRHYLRAVLIGGVAIALSGLVDLALYRTGHSDLLAPLRTASYRLLIDGEIAGSKRVVGFTAEASSYGSLCVGALATLVFLRPFYEPALRKVAVPIVIVILLTMVLLCTSSNAYLGLSVLCCVYGTHLLLRLNSSEPVMREGLWVEVSVLGLAAFALAMVAALHPSALESAYQLFDIAIVRKTSSDSFTERNMWSQVAFDAFFDTGGVGVGLGSVRTSNWFVSILASTGAFGSALLFGFVIYLLCGKGDTRSARVNQMRRGARCAVLPTLAMSALGGTIPDIGVHTASLYGLLVGLQVLPLRRNEEPRRSPGHMAESER